jgi:hypothetical protein
MRRGYAVIAHRRTSVAVQTIARRKIGYAREPRLKGMIHPPAPLPRCTLLAIAVAIGCTAAPAPPPPPAAPAPPAPAHEAEEQPRAEVSRFAADPRVGVYVSTPWGFTTSSYWIEGASGLVIIDTQFLPSAAEELLRAAEATTGKKVELAVVLHANPDKFNGTAAFQRRGIRVVTSEQVLRLIPGIHEKRVKAFYDRYAPDYPKELPPASSSKRMCSARVAAKRTS